MRRYFNKGLFLRSCGAERGFTFIGLLLVLAIILILGGLNFQSATGGGSPTVQPGQPAPQPVPSNPLAARAQRKVNEVKTGVLRIDRAKSDACSATRASMGTDMLMITSSAMGQLPGPEEMSRKLDRYRCPRGGTLQYDDAGNIFCDQHAPAPSGTSVTDL